jgi:hypothetical protein
MEHLYGVEDALRSKLTIPYELAVRTYGSEPNLSNDSERKVFFTVWQFLQKELDEAGWEVRNERR